MSIVSLTAAATHLRVELDQDGEEVQALLDRAESIAQTHIGRTLAEVAEENDDVLPLDIQSAVLLILSTLFEVRESSPFGVGGIDTSNPLSSAVQSLLLPYRSPGIW